MALQEAAEFMYKIGFLDVLLPFILSFTICYAFLQKTEVLGKTARRQNAIISFAFGLIFIAFFDFVQFISSILLLTLFVIGIFFAMLILSIFNSEIKSKNAVIIGVTIVVLIISTYMIFDYSDIFKYVLNPTFVLVALLGWFIYFIIKGDKVSIPSITPTPSTPSTPTRPSRPQRPSAPTGPSTVSQSPELEFLNAISGEDIGSDFEERFGKEL